GRIVRDHLLLDAAAFLGAVALQIRRIRSRRCPDAPGRGRPAGDQAPDAAVHVDVVADHGGAVAAWDRGTGLRDRRRRAEPRLHWDGGTGLARFERAQRAPNVCLLAFVPVPDLYISADRPARRRHPVMARQDADERQRTIRARNRALLLVLLALV